MTLPPTTAPASGHPSRTTKLCLARAGALAHGAAASQGFCTRALCSTEVSPKAGLWLAHHQGMALLVFHSHIFLLSV